MYKQIMPAEGWHFVSKDEQSGKFNVHTLAAWALTEEGDAVIGLIGDVRGGGHQLESSSHKRMVSLVSVPPIVGMYKHISAMTAAELAAIKPKEAAGKEEVARP